MTGVTIDTRLLAVLALAAVLALSAGAVTADSIADVGTDHSLDTEGAMQDWRSDGYAEGEADRLQLDLTVAERRADVGADDALTTDLRNHYLRLEYNEDYAREIRVLIPRAVITPYRSETASLTTDHVATLEPAREGDYLSVTVTVDGPADIVIPLNRDHAISFSLIERLDERIERATGISPLDREHEWAYVDGGDLEDGQYHMDYRLDDVVVQFDASGNETDEAWLNIPKGETVGAPVYLHHVGENEEFVIIATVDDPPDIRYRDEGTFSAEVRGWIHEARQIPGNIRDRLEALLPW